MPRNGAGKAVSGRTAVGSDPEWLDGAGYDAYVGTWSRALALEFTGWLDAPPQARWLDVGCGTGALVAAYVWDYADGLEFLRTFWSVATELHRPATAYEREATFAIAVRGPLEALFGEAGISGIETRPIEIETRFGSFEELWGRFLGAQRLRRGEEPVWRGPSYDLLVALDEKTRSRIREMYRQRLPVAADGSVALQAHAWAVRGTTPL